MALFNYASREISAKIVYYGPGLSGKTTNIESIYSMLQEDQRGKLISLPTETDRTLFFDFLPVELGEIKGFKVRFHLYTVPGQVFYNQTRKLVLQGVDGVVFVADSQTSMLDSNQESLKNLEDNLSTYDKALENLPFVIQYNKRDLKDIISPQDLDRDLNSYQAPSFEAIAITGEGVKETLMEISKMVFNHLRKTLLLESELGGPDDEDIGELVGREIDEKFVREEEIIEEIDEIEDLPEEDSLSVDFEELSKDDEPVHEEEVEGDPVSLAGESPEVESVEESHEEVAVEESPDETEETEEMAAETGTVTPESLLDDIEIEIEEDEEGEFPYEDEAGAGDMGVSIESDGLTFMRLETPYISLEGSAVIPAIFLDGDGNEIRVRVKISIDKG